MNGEEQGHPIYQVPQGTAVRAIADFEPNPDDASNGAIPLTENELGWAFGPSLSGWVFVIMGIPAPFERGGISHCLGSPLLRRVANQR